MINLFIPYYIDKDSSRQVEINECLLRNIRNNSVDNVYVITEPYSLEELSKLPSHFHEATEIQIHERPTYDAIFEIINSEIKSNPSLQHDWNVLINSDIYLDETIALLNNYSDNDFLALSRWDVDKQGNAVHFNRWDSQDTWCFKGKARKMDTDFYQGIAGCDNAIADRAEVAGYNVINPSKTIKTYHLHNSGVRNYNPNNRVSKPYKLITPHE